MLVLCLKEDHVLLLNSEHEAYGFESELRMKQVRARL